MPHGPEDAPLPGLVPCPDCGRQIPRRGGQEHECDPEELADHLVAQLSEEVLSGQLLARAGRWLEEDVEARLRREYLTWQEAGCPAWDEWRRRSGSA